MSDSTGTGNVSPIRPLPATDTWSTASSAYDPSQFYVTSSEAKGDRISRTIWLPASTDAQIVQLIQGGRINEYRTRDDIVRDALVHRLYWVNMALKDGVLGQMLSNQMRQAKLDAVTRNNEYAQKYVQNAIEGMQRASGNPTQLRALLEVVESDLGDPQLSEADRWRLQGEVANYRGMLGDE